jgi:hypothetical protein
MPLLMPDIKANKKIEQRRTVVIIKRMATLNG